jgi:hypothetical protein
MVRAKTYIGFFGAGVMLAGFPLGVGLLTGASATDSAPPGCPRNPDYGDTGGQETLQTVAHHWESRATRSDVWIADDGANCQRISSIYVVSLNGVSTFEFGYVVGWSNCDDYFHPLPTLFYWSQVTATTYSCGTYPTHPTGGQYDQFTAAGLAGGATFRGYYEGTDYTGGIPTTFAEGADWIGQERSFSSDACYARFGNLEEWHSTFGWSAFDKLQPLPVSYDDPICDLDLIDADTGEVHS